MANRLDVVPVRTDHEGRIVVRVVLRAQARRTVVPAARFQGRAMESLDLPAILGNERQVKVRRLFLGSADAQRGLATRVAELDAERPLMDDRHAQRLERLEEERLARLIVGGPEYDVVKHDPPVKREGLHEAHSRTPAAAELDPVAPESAQERRRAAPRRPRGRTPRRLDLRPPQPWPRPRAPPSRVRATTACARCPDA